MISFVIPVYNCKLYLEDCLHSLLRLQDCSYEILLIDDGSTDGSSELCDRLSRQHDCVRCIHQENCGVSATRNRGIEEARGDWLMFVDADDSIDHGGLITLLEELEHNPGLDAVLFGMSFDYYWRGEKYRLEKMAVLGSLQMEKGEWAGRIAELYSCNYLSSACSKLLKKSILHTNNLRFRTEMFLLEDLEFSLRYLSYCETILCSDKMIYHYRQAEDEGNAGRRLLRIPEISVLVDQLGSSFAALAIRTGRDPAEFQSIVNGIFLMLANQKIAVSDRNTIGDICRDYSDWVKTNSIPQEELASDMAQDLLRHRIGKLIARRTYTWIRHKAANRVKYWRFLARGKK